MDRNLNHLSENSKELVKFIESKIRMLNAKISNESTLHKKYLSYLVSEIERKKKDLESNIFFIAVTGGLKSGKSTLINLLCHEVVSTTRTGIETTLRPLLVNAGDKTIVKIYKKNDFTSEVFEITKDDFDTCIDDIKGFNNTQLKNKKIIIEEQELNESNISDLLTNKDYKDSHKIILVHVAIDKNQLSNYQYSLLNQNVAFIDTPGLDGIVSTIGGIKVNSTECKYNKTNSLIGRIDLSVLLQSTVAPLSESSISFIENLKEKKLSPRFFLVHNKFSLKPWIENNHNVDDSDKKSVSSTRENLKKHVGYNIDYETVDFAKADDAFNNTDLDQKIKDTLLKESNFIEFEQKIYKQINDSKGNIHEKNALNKLSKPITEEVLIKLKDLLDNEESKINNKIKHINTTIKNIKLKFAWNNMKSSITKILDQDYNSSIQEKDDGYKLNVVKEKIENLSIKISKKNIEEDTISELKRINKIIKNECKPSSAEAFSEYMMNQKIENQSLEEIISDLKLEYSENIEFYSISALQAESEFKYPVIFKEITKEDLKMPGPFETLYNKVSSSSSQEWVEEIEKDILKNFNLNFETYKENLYSTIEDSFIQYSEILEKHKENMLETIKIKYKGTKHNIEHTRKTIQNIEEFIEEIKNRIV